mmetsp:Transcript_11069/g.37686  ORF Transcript_11069/g.37686 Transcript_11069/m.37686 type:complete len:242 (+) Transcript_11069:215-940(+)
MWPVAARRGSELSDDPKTDDERWPQTLHVHGEACAKWLPATKADDASREASERLSQPRANRRCSPEAPKRRAPHVAPMGVVKRCQLCTRKRWDMCMLSSCAPRLPNLLGTASAAGMAGTRRPAASALRLRCRRLAAVDSMVSADRALPASDILIPGILMLGGMRPGMTWSGGPCRFAMIHGCSSASAAVARLRGSFSRRRVRRSLASSVTGRVTAYRPTWMLRRMPSRLSSSKGRPRKRSA